VTGPVHVTVWGSGRTTAPRAVLVHGTMTGGTDRYGFAAQRPLAEVAELLIVDRRGFGASADVDRSDYELDAADVASIMDGGAHLVGHSYGGVVVMLAAAVQPGDVRSLTLIEPAAHRAAARPPGGGRRARADARIPRRGARDDAAGVAPSLDGVCWTWETAPAAYREAAGEALMACAGVVARGMGADVLRVDGASHWPHAERPDVVNAALRRLWRRAGG